MAKREVFFEVKKGKTMAREMFEIAEDLDLLQDVDIEFLKASFLKAEKQEV